MMPPVEGTRQCLFAWPGSLLKYADLTEQHKYHCDMGSGEHLPGMAYTEEPESAKTTNVIMMCHFNMHGCSWFTLLYDKQPLF